MRALEHPLLADQNIHPKVVEGPAARGLDVQTLGTAGIRGDGPGNIRPEFVLEMLDAIGQVEAEAVPPFIAVAIRRGGTVRVRLRQL